MGHRLTVEQGGKSGLLEAAQVAEGLSAHQPQGHQLLQHTGRVVPPATFQIRDNARQLPSNPKTTKAQAIWDLPAAALTCFRGL